MSLTDEQLAEAIDRLEELLEEVVDRLDLDATVNVSAQDDVLLGSVEGEDLGLFIGRRGQTIEAVQHLAQRIVFRERPSDVRVVIDADGYRERREQVLHEEADAAAEEALRLGEPVGLEPMTPAERRTIHEYLRERGDVDTHSEGQDPGRYLVVSPPS